MTERVLFVDDDPGFLAGLRRLLQLSEPHLVLEFANSVDEAIERIEASPPDALVTDIRMPGKDGFELLAWLSVNQHRFRIPAAVLTGSDESDLKRRALDMGATDLLAKPVDPEDLRARIRSMLRLKHYEDELRELNAHLEEHVALRTRELEQARLDVIWRLARAGEHRDEETGDHVMRVSVACRTIGLQLGMPARRVQLLTIASPLHDIGKIGIPDRILLKPGKLTPQERKIMETHTRIGADILSPTPKRSAWFMRYAAPSAGWSEHGEANEFLELAASLALNHHEKWDGTGYPRGLREEEIPLEARILTICDVWDALLSERPYKRAFTESETLDIIRAETGRHFDPEVSRAFQECWNVLRDIRVELPRADSGLELPEAA